MSGSYTSKHTHTDKVKDQVADLYLQHVPASEEILKSPSSTEELLEYKKELLLPKKKGLKKKKAVFSPYPFVPLAVRVG